MPYDGDVSGVRAIRTLAGSKALERLMDEVAPARRGGPRPPAVFRPYAATGRERRLVVAIDGGMGYHAIRGAYPLAEAGAVSVAVVVGDRKAAQLVPRDPKTGLPDPRALRETETSVTDGAALPGKNLAGRNGEPPGQVFRAMVRRELSRPSPWGGSRSERVIDTLAALVQAGNGDRRIRCPAGNCGEKIAIPTNVSERMECACGKLVYVTDVLRLVEHFDSGGSPQSAVRQLMAAWETLALMHVIRELARTKEGRGLLGEIVFVKDGRLAIFGTAAALVRGIREELRVIQEMMRRDGVEEPMAIIGVIKSGEQIYAHAADLDGGQASGAEGTKLQKGTVWLPDDPYIREHIKPGTGAWGEVTNFGSPAVVKTWGGSRVVVEIARPELEKDRSLNEPGLPDPAALPGILRYLEEDSRRGEVGAVKRAHQAASIPARSSQALVDRLIEARKDEA